MNEMLGPGDSPYTPVQGAQHVDDQVLRDVANAPCARAPWALVAPGLPSVPPAWLPQPGETHTVRTDPYPAPDAVELSREHRAVPELGGLPCAWCQEGTCQVDLMTKLVSHAVLPFYEGARGTMRFSAPSDVVRRDEYPMDAASRRCMQTTGADLVASGALRSVPLGILAARNSSKQVRQQRSSNGRKPLIAEHKVLNVRLVEIRLTQCLPHLPICACNQNPLIHRVLERCHDAVAPRHLLDDRACPLHQQRTHLV